MRYEDSFELTLLISNLKRYIESELIPFEERAGIGPDGEISGETRRHLRQRFRERGFWAIDFPQQYGGGGVNTFEVIRLREEAAKFGSILPLFIFGGPDAPPKILLKGTDEQIQKYLIPSIQAEKTPCFAMTEPNAGSDIHSIETSARKSGSNYVLNGRKHFISNAPFADYAIVVAKTGEVGRRKKEITLFIVDKGTAGFSLGRTHQVLGGGNFQGELVFEDCVVSKDQILGEVGGGLALAAEWLVRGQMIISAGCVGIVDYLLNSSARYAKERVTFGRPLATREAIQAMLAEMAADLFRGKMLLYEAAWRLDHGLDHHLGVCMTKLFTTEMAGRAADKAVQIHGGMGCMKALPFERIYRFVRALRIVEGSSEMQRISIASLVLSGARSLFALRG